MLGEITEAIRFHYAWMRKLQSDIPTSQPRLPEVIADAPRDQLAAKLKAEFWGEHDETESAIEPYVYCQECGNTRQAQLDPRHKYDDPAWQAAADRELTTP